MSPIGGETVLTQKSEGGAIGADLAVVKGATDNDAKLPAAAGDRATGITALAADAAGKSMPVIIFGPAVGTASAAIAPGDPLEVAAASGKLRKAAPAAGVNANIVGIALTSAAADGDTFDLLVVPSVMQG